LIVTVLTRCTFIMCHLFDITVKAIVQEESQNVGILGRYEEFVKELRTIFSNFVKTTRDHCKSKAMDDFQAFTKVIDWDLISGFSAITDYDYLECSKEDTKKRVEAIMGVNRHQSTLQISRSRVVDAQTYNHVLTLAARLFAGVRYFFTKYIRSKFNAFFLDPMFQKLGRELTDHFRKMPDKKYEELFNLGLAQLKQRAGTLEAQLEQVTKQRNKFKEVVNNMKKFT